MTHFNEKSNYCLFYFPLVLLLIFGFSAPFLRQHLDEVLVKKLTFLTCQEFEKKSFIIAAVDILLLLCFTSTAVERMG